MDTPVVLISGALSGIGRATAFAYAHQKARIVISGRRAGEGEQLAAELRSLGAHHSCACVPVRTISPVEYHSQRASEGGPLITEATPVS